MRGSEACLVLSLFLPPPRCIVFFLNFFRIFNCLTLPSSSVERMIKILKMKMRRKRGKLKIQEANQYPKALVWIDIGSNFFFLVFLQRVSSKERIGVSGGLSAVLSDTKIVVDV